MRLKNITDYSMESSPFFSISPLEQDLCESLNKKDLFSPFQLYFARYITALSDEKSSEIFGLALLLSHASTEGNVCITITGLENSEIYQHIKKICFPDKGVQELLHTVAHMSVVGKPGEFYPFILDATRIYLHKYWQYESMLVTKIKHFCSSTDHYATTAHITELLDIHFPQEQNETNWQRVAACVAAMKQLCIITGGPGTGKTTTIINILLFLIQLLEKKNIRVAIAAPTGKAAVRLEETIKKYRNAFDTARNMSNSTPLTAMTIHRLLGIHSRGISGVFHGNNTLPFDIVVIDEASMIDLSLMAQLFSAIPSHARIILCGDHNQLMSVQAGSVFGDLCSQSLFTTFSRSFYSKLQTCAVMQDCTVKETVPLLADCSVALQKVYRFRGALALCSEAIKAGDHTAALRCFSSAIAPQEPLVWIDSDTNRFHSQRVQSMIIKGWQNFLNADDVEAMYVAFSQFRVLCALRSGSCGVGMLNRSIEIVLNQTNLVRPLHSACYHKQPVMILKNDYQLELYNGDIGIIVSDTPPHGQLRAWFPENSSTGSRRFRSFSLSRLPAFETCFAMTVHKSQGSEYDDVFFALPDTETVLLTRELLYTAITRSRKSVTIYGKKQIFKNAVGRKSDRTSGLAEKLGGTLF